MSIHSNVEVILNLRVEKAHFVLVKDAVVLNSHIDNY